MFLIILRNSWVDLQWLRARAPLFYLMEHKWLGFVVTSLLSFSYFFRPIFYELYNWEFLSQQG